MVTFFIRSKSQLRTSAYRRVSYFWNLYLKVSQKYYNTILINIKRPLCMDIINQNTINSTTQHIQLLNVLIQLPPAFHHSLFCHVLWKTTVGGISISSSGKNHSWPRQLFLKPIYATKTFHLTDRMKRDSKNFRQNL